jgi:hypothetical protein
MELTNSKRLLYKVSHVTTQFTPDEQRNIEKARGFAPSVPSSRRRPGSIFALGRRPSPV